VSTIFAMIALLLAGSGDVAFAAEPRAPATPLEIIAYHDSGQWNADTTQVVGRARRFVERHLNDRRPVIVLDIDDTALSNYDCLEAVDFNRSATDCAAGGDLPAIPQTLGLYRYARARGVMVFFVTGRRTSVRGTTIANLRRAGYKGALRVFLRPNRQRLGRYAGWKARTRRAITRSGYEIVANVGDQRSDLDGGAALRAFKLPNPMYLIPSA
jgi:predicted secreted acid phosphatase